MRTLVLISKVLQRLANCVGKNSNLCLCCTKFEL